MAAMTNRLFRIGLWVAAALVVLWLIWFGPPF
jgi:hypothetical protein